MALAIVAVVERDIILAKALVGESKYCRYARQSRVLEAPQRGRSCRCRCGQRGATNVFGW